MLNFQKTKSVLFLALSVSCFGFSFGPGYSLNDPEYFQEPPHIVSS